MKSEDIERMLDRETWIGGSDAVEQGFADRLLPSDEISTDARNSSGQTVSALRKVDALLARAGASRSERRELLAALKGGKPGAASTGMQDAAVITEIENILDFAKSIRAAN